MYSFWQFLSDNRAQLLEQSLEHIGLTLLSLLLAALLAIPLGIAIADRPKIAGPVLGLAGVLQTVPSVALLGFLIPVIGIGIKPAIVALFLHALLPILRNTYIGIRGVNAAVVEAAVGMGMRPGQVLGRVQLPLALPVIYAGLRTAAVINVGVATLAAYIGAGGLGEFIFGGIALNNSHMILAGALPAALLALIFDQGLAWLQRRPLRSTLPKWIGGIALLFAAYSWSSTALAPGLASGFEPEYMGRRDGFDHLQNIYREADFQPVILNSALMYRALRDGAIDLACGYATDGRIKAYHLRVLEDDLGAFPPYFCAAVIRKGTAAAHPEVVAAMEQLAGLLTDSVMTALNYQVDYEHLSPEQVARTFLTERGLWRADRRQGGEVVTIGSKIFTEQYILTELFAQLIDGHTDLDVKKVPGLGGTKICFDALTNGEIDIYPEYSGTAFQVILHPPEALSDSIFNDRTSVYDYVRTEFAEQYDLRWLSPLGFKNTYALLVREGMAQRKGWERGSDLEE